jgi:hypothetical protein
VRALAPLSRIPRVNAATEAALRVTHAALPVIAITIGVADPAIGGQAIAARRRKPALASRVASERAEACERHLAGVMVIGSPAS